MVLEQWAGGGSAPHAGRRLLCCRQCMRRCVHQPDCPWHSRRGGRAPGAEARAAAHTAAGASGLSHVGGGAEQQRSTQHGSSGGGQPARQGRECSTGPVRSARGEQVQQRWKVPAAAGGRRPPPPPLPVSPPAPRAIRLHCSPLSAPRPRHSLLSQGALLLLLGAGVESQGRPGAAQLLHIASGGRAEARRELGTRDGEHSWQGVQGAPTAL